MDALIDRFFADQLAQRGYQPLEDEVDGAGHDQQASVALNQAAAELFALQGERIAEMVRMSFEYVGDPLTVLFAGRTDSAGRPAG